MKRLVTAAAGLGLAVTALAACTGTEERVATETATPPPATATSRPSTTPMPSTSTATPAQPQPTRTPQPQPSPTQPPEPTPTDKPVPSPTATLIPPTPTGTPAGPSATNGVFDVTVLVDPQGRRISEADITRVFTVAVSRLHEMTGQRMQLVDIVYGLPRGGSVTGLVDNHLATAAPSPPEGIVVLSEDEQASAYGGYSFVRHLPPPFSNEFESPRPGMGGDAVYIAVIHFDHLYGRCGYDDNGNHVSDVSIGGECRNQPGTPCVQQEGGWMCVNLQGYPYGDHDFFVASNIVHEFLHPFGIASDGVLDHYGSPECMSRTGMTPEQAADLREAQLNVMMCPDVFSRFRPSP